MSENQLTYCVKCKTKQPMQNAKAVFTKTGQPGTRGTCPVCGTSLYRMGATPAHKGMQAPKVVARSKSKPKSKAKSTRPVKRKGKLVIVESPAKARTIERYLGKNHKVKASVGHVRDLLKSQLSVDVENDFEPHYRVPNNKRDVVKDLKAAAGQAEEIYLATDPDREGEAIAWHLIHAAEIDDARVRRVVFHEITKDAVQKAFAHPRQIDMHLVDAQQARRILDRLVGYELSPLLWDKVRPRLSAGRVQSVAVRLVVERERAIDSFVPEEYWTIDAELARAVERDIPDRQSFVVRLIRIRGEEINLPTQGAVEPILEELEKAEYVVDEVKEGQRKRKPLPPFITSTLQQESSRRLGFTARRTMNVAQQLYEGVDTGNGGEVGLITYMRTDSTNVAAQAQAEAKSYILETYGKDYLPDQPNVYGKKAKGAQEAHEAVRPTSVYRTPESLKKYLTKDQFQLYCLIWQRFVASQMAAAEYDTISVDVLAGPTGSSKQDKPYLFRASGSILRFAGFLVVYGDVPDEDNPEDEELGRLFPELLESELLDLLRLLPEQHFTQPPPRYTEASLVKTLEEYGIGRPSTYAPILNTIQARGYVRRESKRFFPTDIGLVVNDLLVEHFPDIVGVDFTATMEDKLDQVASGEHDWVPVVAGFYHPFKAEVDRAFAEVPGVELGSEEVGRNCPKCGSPLIIRWGRYGKFIGCSTFPDCRYTEPWLEKLGISCPDCGGDLVERKTRRGRVFYGCSNYPTCEWTSWKKPLPDPCPVCGGLLIMDSKQFAKCLACGHQVPVDTLPAADKQKQGETL
ncbi:MAG: type I DNA topoisomerase [Anaerolineae bacterium]|nr:type I DNA topoisomerase [Anaerolineae bacterium]